MSRARKIRQRLGDERRRRRITPSEVALTHGGLYSLPDGTMVVAAVAPGGRHLLYHPIVWAGQAWLVDMPVSFVITEEGHLYTRSGRPTGWGVEDLEDTHRAAGKEK